MEKKLHTKKDAEYCLWCIKKYICADAKLIGSFGKGAEQSEKDIDIYLPNFFPPAWHDSKAEGTKMRAWKTREKIKHLIEAEKVEITDWGGWFYTNSIFGNVDIFFDITQFDY